LLLAQRWYQVPGTIPVLALHIAGHHHRQIHYVLWELDLLSMAQFNYRVISGGRLSIPTPVGKEEKVDLEREKGFFHIRYDKTSKPNGKQKEEKS